MAGIGHSGSIGLDTLKVAVSAFPMVGLASWPGKLTMN